MKNIFKSGVKRILAGALAMVTAIAALPLQSLAAEIKPTAAEPGINLMSVDVGGTAYTLFGKDFEPSDGDAVENSAFYYRYYDGKANEWKIGYHTSTTDAGRLLMAESPTASSGEYAICLEAGKDFEDGTVYKSKTIAGSEWRKMIKNGEAAKYCMTNADQYIALAIYYGMNSANYTAVSGSNTDDWVIATQVLVWEFQQGLRTGLTGSAGSNSSMQSRTFDGGRTLSWNTFRARLGGSTTNRAEAYNWILQHIKAENTKPSFNGMTLKLTYNSSTGKYTGSVKDTNASNGIYHTLTRLSGSGVTVSRSGNTYTFTANAPISGTVKFGHSSTSDDNMRVYESTDSTHQAMANGMTNPINYSINIVTGTTGSLTIDKTWIHNGDPLRDYDDIYFYVIPAGGTPIKATGSDGNYTYATGLPPTKLKLNSSDTLTVHGLPVGTYRVYEYGMDEGDIISGYTRKGGNLKTVTVNADAESKVEFTNTRNTESGHVYKKFDGATGTAAQNAQVKFTVQRKNANKDYVQASTTSIAGRYEFKSLGGAATKYSLNSAGHFLIAGLPSGTYIVTETDAPDGWELAEPQELVVSGNGGGSVTFNNTESEGGLKIVKKWIPADRSDLDQATLEKNNEQIRFTIQNTSTGKYPALTGSNGDSKRAFSGTWNSAATQYKVNAESGTLEVTDLPSGTYKVTEVWADGATIQEEWTIQGEKSGTVSNGKMITYTFQNTQGTRVELTKIFENSENMSAEELKEHYKNVQFRVHFSPVSWATTYWFLTGSNGKYEYSTNNGSGDSAWYSFDENGKATIDIPSGSGLGPYTYVFEERYNGEDYNTDGEKRITADWDAAGFSMPLQEITFTNTAKNGSLEVVKSFEEDGKAAEVSAEQIAQVGFIVSKGYKDVQFDGSNGNYTYAGLTDGRGTVLSLSAAEKKFTALELPVGTYTITEVNGATGFNVAVSEQTFTISAAQKSTVRFVNEAMKGTLVIQKQSADNVLAGWQFRVQLVSSPFVGYTYNQTFTTGADGKITLSNLRIGTYRVTEVTTGAEAYITPASQENEVTFNRTTTFTFENIPLGSVEAVKYDADNHSVKLHGAKFAVRAAEQITMENGTVLFAEDAQVATLSESGTSGKYVLDNGIKINGTTTNKLPYGKYYLVETTAPANYVLDSTRHDFSITKAGQVISIDVDDPAMKGTLVIQKHSADNVLAGWKFRVQLVTSPFEDYSYDQTFSTNERGQITVSNLRIGTYKVTEVVTGEEHYITPGAQNVEITYNNTKTLDFTNIPLGNVHVTKVDRDYRDVKLTGAEFTVYQSDKNTVVGKLSEISTGEYQLNNIPYGDYFIKETKAPANYVADGNFYPFAIRVAGATVTVATNGESLFYNAPQTGTLTIQKRSADNVLEGWEFRIELVTSPFAKYTYNQTFKTNKDGIITLPNLRIGTYKITELTTGEVHYIIPPSKEVVVEFGKETTADMTNIPLGNVHVTKVDSELTDVKLSGAEFTVYQSDKNTVVGKLSEIATGEYQLNDIPYGDYFIKETKAPANFVADNNFYPFAIRVAGATVTVSNNDNGTFSNTAQKGNLLIHKRTADNVLSGWQFRVQLVTSPFEGYTYDKTLATNDRGEVTFSNLRIGTYKITEITTGKTGYIFATAQNAEIKYNETTEKTFENIPIGNVHVTKVDKEYPDNKLTGAEFTVYAAKDIVTLGGQTLYTKGTVMGKLSEIATGEYQLNDLPYGDYILKETKAPANYIPDETEYPFSIRVAGATVAVESTPRIGLENNPMRGNLSIRKSSPDGIVEGWKFRIQLVTSPFEDYTYDKTYTTDSNGVINMYGLRIGTYKVTEVVTGEEHYITPDPQNGTLTYNKLTVLEFTNIPLGNVHVTKVDSEYPDVKLTGAEFTVYQFDQSTVVGTLKEIEPGEYQLDDLPYGNYILKETKAPENFVLDPNVYPFVIRVAGETVQVGNVVMPASLAEMSDGDINWSERIFAYPQSGIVVGENPQVNKYPFVDSEVVGSYNTGNDILIAGMTDNFYKTADGGFISADEVMLNAVDSDFLDAPNKGTLSIVKTDISYGTPIEGVGYRIRNEQGEIVAEGYTDAEGKLDFVLRYGKYTFEEFDEQDGYFPNHTEYPFEITENGQIIKADMTNEQFPKIGTTAAVGEDKDAIAQGTITLNDVVEYHALVPGREYTIKGILMDKSTGEPFIVNGEEVTAETVFTPEQPDGEITVTFVFNADGIKQHTTVVAFETLYVDDTEYAVHADINDEGQTVELHKPEVKTTASANGEKETVAVGEVTIDDVVAYHDLIVGKEYTVKGTLMDKSTGKAFTVNGKEITAEAKFTAKTEDGEVKLSFTFDASAITKNTTLVVFEKLYKDDVEIAVHTDIDDEDQTVELHKPEIGTTATANGGKTVKNVGTVTINDVVEYHDLIVGKEYTIKGILMNKSTGKAFTVGGKEITAEAKFTAEKSDGEVTVTFTFDASGITEQTEIVAFETLYKDGVEIAVHADINDKAQTVTVTVPPENPTTGVGIDGGAALLAAGALAAAMLMKKKKEEEKD